MTLSTQEITTKNPPTAAVIWMHGLGADGSDFVPIVQQLNLSDGPGIRFIFPDAPKIPVTINGGVVMPAWYDIVTMDIHHREDDLGVRHSQAAIEQLIAQECARGIPAHNIVIAGFSQGAAMSFQVGLRYPQTLAGLLCLSGYLPMADSVALEHHPANAQTPIFQAHGLFDPIVPLASAQHSRQVLNDLGYNVEWHTYPMQHSVCSEEVRDIGMWLRRVLGGDKKDRMR